MKASHPSDPDEMPLHIRWWNMSRSLRYSRGVANSSISDFAVPTMHTRSVRRHFERKVAEAKVQLQETMKEMRSFLPMHCLDV